MIKIAITRPPVEHGAVEPEFGYGSVEFGCGSVRIRRRQRCEALQAIGMATHGVGEPVVTDTLQCHRISRIEVLQSRRRHRDDSNVESLVVHRGDPLGVDIHQPTGKLVIGRADERDVPPLRLQRVPRVDELGRCEVFFQANDLHVRDDKRVY
jgi:hypothetical protein